eukprot:11156401-Lingulodinium_polyedra.AAC.1
MSAVPRSRAPAGLGCLTGGGPAAARRLRPPDAARPPRPLSAARAGPPNNRTDRWSKARGNGNGG